MWTNVEKIVFLTQQCGKWQSYDQHPPCNNWLWIKPAIKPRPLGLHTSALTTEKSQPSYFIRRPKFGLDFPFHLVKDQTHVCMCISMLYQGWCVSQLIQFLHPSAAANHLYPESCLHILDGHALTHHKTGTTCKQNFIKLFIKYL